MKSEAIPTNIFEKGIIKYYESLKNLGKSKEVIGIINDGYTDEEIEIYKEKMKQWDAASFYVFSACLSI